jgi:hypothetical protein
MVDLTKNSPAQQSAALRVHHQNIMRSSYAHTFRTLTLIPFDDWQASPPLSRDRGRIELTANYEHCYTCNAMVRVRAYHSTPGFGAGYVHTIDLSCGHQITHDDSYAEI